MLCKYFAIKLEMCIYKFSDINIKKLFIHD